MIINKTEIEGLLEIEPNVLQDDRGYFLESFRLDVLRNIGIDVNFVQDNESASKKGVLRGLHFQSPPYEQGKLVRVIKGSVLDVAVDIRVGSPTFGKHCSILLSEQNKKQFWIPPGFAHGFLVLEDDTIFSYKCTGYYRRESEGALRWDDPALNIPWNFTEPILSEKDKVAPLLSELVSPFH
jgi:dTDP-4-dehydrorhamnose 3,5-epimerase